MFKAGGSNDLEYAGRFIAGVPEGMPLIAGLEHKITRLTKHHIVAKLSSETSSKYIAVFVFTRMAVQRGGQRAGRHRVFYQ